MQYRSLSLSCHVLCKKEGISVKEESLTQPLCWCIERGIAFLILYDLNMANSSGKDWNASCHKSYIKQLFLNIQIVFLILSKRILMRPLKVLELDSWCQFIWKATLNQHSEKNFHINFFTPSFCAFLKFQETILGDWEYRVESAKDFM